MPIDKYANIATFSVLMSAANTLTFVELLTGLGIEPDRKSARGMLIDEIDYMPAGNMINEMTTALDVINYALSISNAPTDLNDMTDTRILHTGRLQRQDLGTAATAWVHKLPLVYQFFPPLVTAERRIYLGADSVGLASAGTIRARMYYRAVEITQADFIELAEIFRLVG